MKPYRPALLVAALLFASASAHASYTIDLVWSDTGTPTLTVSPGDASATSNGTPCETANAPAQFGRCLEFRVTAAAPFSAALVELGWNQTTSGLDVARIPARSFAVASIPGFTPATPTDQSPVPCNPPCQRLIGPFGGTRALIGGSDAPAGSYRIGSILLDASGLLVGGGPHVLTGSLASSFLDKKGNPVPVQLNGAIIAIIPEPSTAALLGAGLLSLLAATRSRRNGA